MWTLLIPIVKMILGGFKERKEAENERYKAELRAGIHDPQKLRWLKWASFIQFSAPIWMGAYDPVLLDQVLTALERLPDWYTQTYIAMNGSIWGAAVSSDIVSKILKAYRKREKS